MIKQLLILVLAALLLAASACDRKKDEVILARVDGEELYLSDIYMPADLHGTDSVAFLNNMVQQWIVEQLMYAEAKEKMSEEELDIDREVERMKRQLVVGRYEQKLLSDSVNFVINESEALQYYEDNPEEFMLKDNIVRVRYVKIPIENPETEEFRTLLKSNEASDYSKLVKLCNEQALNSFIDDMVWLYFNDLLKEVPIKTYNQEEFLNNNRFVELEKDSVLFLLNIKGFMVKDSRAPFPLVKEKIISILQARKNKELLKEHRNKLYKSALSEKKIEVFL